MVINVCTCHLNIYMFSLSFTVSLTIKLTSEGPRALEVRAKVLMTQRVIYRSVRTGRVTSSITQIY